MDVGVYSYPLGDPILIDKIVNEFLSQGKFDKLRKECMSDADTKPAYQNLQQRVENTVTQFLRKQVWRPDLNKNQLRDSLRKHILESKFFDAGINRIVDQVVNPNLLATVFLPEVEEVVYSYLSIPKPSERSQKKESSEEGLRACEREYESRTSHDRQEKVEESEGGGYRKEENHLGDEELGLKEESERKQSKEFELFSEPVKTEPEEEKLKQESEEVVEMEFSGLTDESQESLNRMAAEGMRIEESEIAGIADSDDSVPLEINEKTMSDSRDSEDSIMNQMSPISQGRLTPELEGGGEREEVDEEEVEVEVEVKEEKPEEEVTVALAVGREGGEEVEVKEEKMEEEEDEEEEGEVEVEVKQEKVEEKKPTSFIGRIPKIKREDSSKAKEKSEGKVLYSSDESDSSKSYGRSDSDEKRKRSEKREREREKEREEREREREREKEREREREREREKERERERERKRERSRDRHREERRERSRERHKKNSSSSSSSQRERSSSHHKSSHRHKESRSRRKEEERRKSKNTDDHGKEKMKKEDRRSTDRDSNERERERSSGSRGHGEGRRREKEQEKTEEGRRGGSQKGEEEMEEEGGVVLVGEREGCKGGCESVVVEFSELLQTGALRKVEFAKLTDDFYVKFNSTGFRYFEEWEKAKLDCEEEFKEFVDEAENDLSLLSDDESEFELERSFGEENRRTIVNLLRGVGNFSRSLTFDPVTAEFYGWTDVESFERFQKNEKREKRRSEKKETVESIKENIERGEKARTLQMKLLSKYRRKALKMGKTRKRQRRPGSWGIKEKNENGSISRKRFFDVKSRPFFASRVPILPGCNLVEPENPSVPQSMNGVNIFGEETVRLPDSPEENEDWPGTEKNGSRGKTNADNTRLGKSLPLNLPPSPDSDDINNGATTKEVGAFRKRIGKDAGGLGTPKKQARRNYSQKYDSQDLYKPRLMLNSSRTRGKERGLDREGLPIDSAIPR